MGRRKRRATDWVVAHWSEGPTSVSGFGGTVAGEPTILLLDMLSSADLTEHDDRMTCIRLVGQYRITAAEDTGMAAAPDLRRIGWRVWKGTERDNPAGTVPTALEINRLEIANTANADDEYMATRWLNFPQGITWAVGDIMVGGVDDTVPYWSHFDIRVARKLSNEERIIWQWENHCQRSDGAEFTVAISMWCRALVKIFVTVLCLGAVGG